MKIISIIGTPTSGKTKTALQLSVDSEKDVTVISNELISETLLGMTTRFNLPINLFRLQTKVGGKIETEVVVYDISSPDFKKSLNNFLMELPPTVKTLIVTIPSFGVKCCGVSSFLHVNEYKVNHNEITGVFNNILDPHKNFYQF